MTDNIRMGPRFKIHKRLKGQSLAEVMIGLTIFSVIIFPMAILPMKAVEVSSEAGNGSFAQYEIQTIFTEMSHEISQAYRFLPAVAHANFTTNQQLFLAYWDEKTQTTKRAAYAFREMKDPDTSLSYTPKRWQLEKHDKNFAGLSAANGIITTLNYFGPFGKVVHTKDFYITTADNTPPIFVYCRGKYCNAASPAKPEEADGVKIQANSGTSGTLIFNYRGSKMKLDPMYFRLASMQTQRHRNFAENQVLPFTAALNRWDSLDTWAAERTVAGVGGLGSFNVAIDKVPDEATAVKLPFNDFHYNLKSGELLAVSNSPDTSLNEAALYIFKFKPGMKDYKPYQMNLLDGGSYHDSFPIILHRDDPEWPTPASSASAHFVEPKFLSVTQDNEDNIYVLVQTEAIAPYRYWIEKFSPEGVFKSRFSLGAVTDVKTAYGITYTPGTPNELLVLMKKFNDDPVIRAYPKEQNQDDPLRTVYSAESPALDNAGTTPTGFSWDNAAGFDYDVIHNRFLVLSSQASSTPNDYIQIVSIPNLFMTVDSKDQAQGSVFLNRLYAPSIDITPFRKTNKVPTGIAFDPLNNTVYLSTTEGANHYYYQIIPRDRLNIAKR